ncbi:MAG: hypothetical protein C0497_05315 [Gemmatimonas sp.]|nr:hypothetical protein [Gemmatimonas sp.]
MRPLLLFTIVAVAACDSSSPTGATPQTPIVRERIDVRYANTSNAQRLDLYLPATGDGPFPLVVWIHGGAFVGGSKSLAA